MGDYRRHNYNQRRDYVGDDYEYDRRGGQGNYQRSFVGQKRRRDEPPPLDPRQTLAAKLLKLGEPKKPQGRDKWSIEGELADVAKFLEREKAYSPSEVIDLILEASVSLTTKTPYLATLVGLLNTEASEFVEKIIEKSNEQFNESLAQGDFHRGKMLLRFFCALVLTNVLSASSVISALDAVVETAVASLSAVPSGAQKAWQLWSDKLVSLVVLALPWARSELADSVGPELRRVGERIDAYLAARPYSESAEFRPFFVATGDNDAAARSDSGGASLLPELWSAVKVCGEQHGWDTVTIPRAHETFEPRLLSATPHQLPHVSIPQRPPFDLPGISGAEALCAALAAFPPRGHIRLLDPKHTEGGGGSGGAAAAEEGGVQKEGQRQPLEYFIAQEYFIDTLVNFRTERVECARQLVGLPLPFPREPLLAETLFAQMLRLPAPQLRPVCYGTLIAAVCKLAAPFARSMSACIRECFVRLSAMEPELRSRLAEWLAYHLSNFGYMWPWNKWEAVLALHRSAPQRAFCREVIARLVRLSYWDLVAQDLFEPFRVLLGPRPSLPLLAPSLRPPAPPAPPPGPPPPLAGAAEGPAAMEADAEGVQDAGDAVDGGKEHDGGGATAAEANAVAATEGQEPQEVEMHGAGDGTAVANGAVPVNTPVHDVAEDACVEAVLEQLADMRRSHAGGDALLRWIDNTQEGWPPAQRTPRGLLRVVLRAVLSAGSKTFSHLVKQLEAHESALKALAARVSAAEGVATAGEDEVVALSALFWDKSPQKVVLALDRLMCVEVASPAAVVRWVFSRSGLCQPGDPLAAATGVEVLALACNAAAGAVEQHHADVALLQRDIVHLQALCDSYAEQVSEAVAGTDDDSRAIGRVTTAAAEEAAAREEVTALRARLDAQPAQLAAMERALGDALLAGLVGFASLLSASSTAAAAAPNDADVATWHSDNLGHLRSFARLHVVKRSAVLSEAQQLLAQAESAQALWAAMQPLFGGTLPAS